MEKGTRFLVTCLSFLITVPLAILAIGFVNELLGRLATAVVMVLIMLLVRKFPLNMTGDLYELESNLSFQKKIIILFVILLGALAGIVLSLQFGFF
ncbi:MAG: hypothetical protein HY051_00630 [Candidatus Aenigmarchaeota archaeon]|nr:hypothetical protein [Candidatus Aenigmarchaeota archaeon]